MCEKKILYHSIEWHWQCFQLLIASHSSCVEKDGSLHWNVSETFESVYKKSTFEESYNFYEIAKILDFTVCNWPVWFGSIEVIKKRLDICTDILRELFTIWDILGSSTVIINLVPSTRWAWKLGYKLLDKFQTTKVIFTMRFISCVKTSIPELPNKNISSRNSLYKDNIVRYRYWKIIQSYPSVQSHCSWQ